MMLDFSAFMNTVGLDFDLGIISQPLWSNQLGHDPTAGATVPGFGSPLVLENQDAKQRRIPDSSIGDGEVPNAESVSIYTDVCIIR